MGDSFLAVAHTVLLRIDPRAPGTRIGSIPTDTSMSPAWDVMAGGARTLRSAPDQRFNHELNRKKEPSTMAYDGVVDVNI